MHIELEDQVYQSGVHTYVSHQGIVWSCSYLAQHTCTHIDTIYIESALYMYILLWELESTGEFELTFHWLFMLHFDSLSSTHMKCLRRFSWRATISTSSSFFYILFDELSRKTPCRNLPQLSAKHAKHLFEEFALIAGLIQREMTAGFDSNWVFLRLRSVSSR